MDSSLSDLALPATPTTASPEVMKAMIVKLVLGELGIVDRFLGVKVYLVWENHYRVNVVVGTDLGHGRIGRSFFLVFDEAGDIVSSTPSLIAAA
jgi:hypothetical protein